MIQPNFKPAARNTIILRDIPSDASKEELMEIFTKDDKCAKPSEIRSDVGDTWFVTMKNEEEAKTTLLYLQLSGVKFKGKAVKGRLKSENILRSSAPGTGGGQRCSCRRRRRGLWHGRCGGEFWEGYGRIRWDAGLRYADGSTNGSTNGRAVCSWVWWVRV